MRPQVPIQGSAHRLPGRSPLALRACGPSRIKAQRGVHRTFLPARAPSVVTDFGDMDAVDKKLACSRLGIEATYQF
jgi:hypothetical protein